jgi:early endosome antigen 1
LFCPQAQSDFSPQKAFSGEGHVDGAGIEAESAEGFICPSCMRGFAQPEELEKHYTNEHVNNTGSGSGGVNNLADLKDEVQELQTTLKVGIKLF